ncbi:nitroreductase family protein [Pseudomonas hunanensis]|uniref:Nitroreductase family protein n=1 Tax=Pseudomonas hunanensis TaxID=1247546 RepID=A0ABD6MUC3_9PSED|nr:nitroreductase [Pseudomonas hunanensis]NWL45032.1 nitroreductase family protein [Pseudomonas hunanensis]
MSPVAQTVKNRHSTRAFLSQGVDESVLREVIEAARYAPSSGNLQPWRLYVLTGHDLAQLKEQAAITLSANPHGEGMGYSIYPRSLKPEYQSRRGKCAEDLYATINVTREDREGRAKQFARNFTFFDAPVGMILAIDRSMGRAQWADLGMYLQTLMLLAQERGLATCAQACWTLVHETVQRQLRLPDELMVFCGVAVGYADTSHAINALRTDREPLEALAEFRGFA